MKEVLGFLFLTGFYGTIGFVCVLRAHMVVGWYVKRLAEHRWMARLLTDPKMILYSIMSCRLTGAVALVTAGVMAAELVRAIYVRL